VATAGRDRRILDIKHKDILICQYENPVNVPLQNGDFRAAGAVGRNTWEAGCMWQVIQG